LSFHVERLITMTCHMQICHQYCRSRTNFATVAAIDAKSEPLEHDITSLYSSILCLGARFRASDCSQWIRFGWVLCYRGIGHGWRHQASGSLSRSCWWHCAQIRHCCWQWHIPWVRIWCAHCCDWMCMVWTRRHCWYGHHCWALWVWRVRHCARIRHCCWQWRIRSTRSWSVHCSKWLCMALTRCSCLSGHCHWHSVHCPNGRHCFARKSRLLL
jgi:hypothetical protein